MSQIEYKKVKIREICTPAKADKTLTRSKAKDKEGNYPVYAATVGEVFAYVNDYNNTQPCLVVVNDGDAGNTYIVTDEKYTIGKHATGLIPNSNIDLIYLQKVATPIFQNIAKGYGLGNLPKTDILNAEVNIPIKDGKYDIHLQQELSKIYFQIDEQRQCLLKKAYELKEISVSLPEDNSVRWKHVRPIELFTPQNGNSGYTKDYCKSRKGVYPLYSGNTDGPFEFIDTFDYDGEYLTWAKDGLAGYLMLHNEKFSLTGHRGILLPTPECKNIDLKYIKFVLEPLFRGNKKGREGDLGKNEYTTLNSVMIKRLESTIPIPVNEDGTYDLEKQKELSTKYEQIEVIKNDLFNKVIELTNIIPT